MSTEMRLADIAVFRSHCAEYIDEAVRKGFVAFAGSLSICAVYRKEGYTTNLQAVVIRDDKQPDQSRCLVYDQIEFNCFVHAAKAGEFKRLFTNPPEGAMLLPAAPDPNAT